MEIGHDDPDQHQRHLDRPVAQLTAGAQSPTGEGALMAVYDRRERDPNYKGNKPWVADYTDADGKRRAPGFRTRDAANAYYRRAQDEVSRGVHEARAQSMTFGEATKAWLDQCRLRTKISATAPHSEHKMLEGTLQNYERCAERHVLPALGRIKLCDLTQKRCQDFIYEKAAQYGGGVQKLCGIIVTLVLKHAMDSGMKRIILRTPLKVPMPDQRIRIPTLAELNQLLRSLETRFHLENRHVHEYRDPMIKLGMFAGLRAGEVSGLQWENLDFVNGVIQVRHSFSPTDGLKGPKTKAGVRDIPMAQKICQALQPVGQRAGWPSTGFVFLGGLHRDGLPIYEAIRGEYFYYSMKHAGLVDENGKMLFTFHALRHAFASLLIRAGYSQIEVAKLMGHGNLRSLEVYSHLFEDCNRPREAIDRINGQFTLAPPAQHPCNMIGESVDLIEVS